MLKKLLVLGVFLNAVLLAGRFWEELPASAARGSGAAVEENGDVNGDGIRDIADPIYLLVWLFSGGPEPVACAQSDLESRVETLEAVIAGCLSFPDRNANGRPDCSEPPFCGNGRCDPDETLGTCPEDCRQDADQDGFPTPDDCDDTDPLVHPGAEEVCDRSDNDCNGVIDEGFNLLSDPNNCGDCGNRCPPGSTCAGGACASVDEDADGFHSGVDCDDHDATVFPGAIEICDLRDNDCDGMIDDQAATSFCNPCINGQRIPRNCDDGNPCTLDQCNEAMQACVHPPAPNGTVCPGGFCNNGNCIAP